MSGSAAVDTGRGRAPTPFLGVFRRRMTAPVKAESSRNGQTTWFGTSLKTWQYSYFAHSKCVSFSILTWYILITLSGSLFCHEVKCLGVQTIKTDTFTLMCLVCKCLKSKKIRPKRTEPIFCLIFNTCLYTTVAVLPMIGEFHCRQSKVWRFDGESYIWFSIFGLLNGFVWKCTQHSGSCLNEFMMSLPASMATIRHSFWTVYIVIWLYFNVQTKSILVDFDKETIQRYNQNGFVNECTSSHGCKTPVHLILPGLIFGL